MEIRVPLRLSQLFCFTLGLLLGTQILPAHSDTFVSKDGIAVKGPKFYCELQKMSPQERNDYILWCMFRMQVNEYLGKRPSYNFRWDGYSLKDMFQNMFPEL